MGPVGLGEMGWAPGWYSRRETERALDRYAGLLPGMFLTSLESSQVKKTPAGGVCACTHRHTCADNMI